MQVFMVGIEGFSLDICRMIEKRASHYKLDNIELSLEEKELGGIRFCQCIFKAKKGDRINEEQLAKESLNHIVNIITDTIMEDFQIIVVEKIIHDEYFYFEKDEKKKILFDALRIIWGNQDGQGEYLALQEWRNKIMKRVSDHLKHHSEIVIDGFIRFRLKDFIEEGVERAVDDMLIEKEYNEFIKLLRYFVEIQEPKVEEVHVLIQPNKKYVLLDSSYRIIDNELMEDLAKEITDKDISYDDLLISSLITIAPNRITIHNGDNAKNTEIINTINNVFFGKVTISQDHIQPH
jgi:putative sporulation protein YtxC